MQDNCVILRPINSKEMNGKDILNSITSAQTNQQVEEYYDRIAETYDKASMELFGRSEIEDKPFLEKTIKYVPKDACILDAGVGTGIIGKYLYNLGFHNLVGIDISRGMLAQAHQKQVYTSLERMVLGETLDFPDCHFDATIISRTFAQGNAPSSSFDELIRITKPGGYLLFTIKTAFYESSDFKDKVIQLETSGKWEVVEVGETYQPLPKVEPTVYYQVRVCRIN